eukprot:TRINITY_DN1515_c0_g1_i1.p1 TRINITY_DN1515_c0_g1~~TRINITY_DN1515_c0_g1_i1.p1  ORF type:complete len:110 (+),score=7.23 TRINITY_DN1515_c0_g1_i1:484-813(+)
MRQRSLEELALLETRYKTSLQNPSYNLWCLMRCCNCFQVRGEKWPSPGFSLLVGSRSVMIMSAMSEQKTGMWHMIFIDDAKELWGLGVIGPEFVKDLLHFHCLENTPPE